MTKTDELNMLYNRVLELGNILVGDSITELCDKVAYSHYMSSSYMTINELKQALILHTKDKEAQPNKVVFDDDIQEKAFRVLHTCYTVRCGEHGFLLGDGDIISGLTVATGAPHHICERFFAQHYTKQGVVR